MSRRGRRHRERPPARHVLTGREVRPLFHMVHEHVKGRLNIRLKEFKLGEEIQTALRMVAIQDLVEAIVDLTVIVVLMALSSRSDIQNSSSTQPHY